MSSEEHARVLEELKEKALSDLSVEYTLLKKRPVGLEGSSLRGCIEGENKKDLLHAIEEAKVKGHTE